MTAKARKLVRIEWDDHCSHGDDWRQPKAIPHEPCANTSVGWVLKEDAKAVTIFHNASDLNGEQEMVCGAMTILKRNIKSRKVIG